MVTFTFELIDDGESTISKTQSGITLTLFNPVGTSSFTSDADGLWVSDDGGGNPSGFNLSVAGATLELTGYTVGATNGATSGTTMSMSGTSGSSTGNSMATVGTFAANGNVQLAPGTNGAMSFTGFGSGAYSQLKSLTFSFQDPPAVPEPGTVGLALAGAAVLGVRAWRRRGRRAAA